MLKKRAESFGALEADSSQEKSFAESEKAGEVSGLRVFMGWGSGRGFRAQGFHGLGCQWLGFRVLGRRGLRAKVFFVYGLGCQWLGVQGFKGFRILWSFYLAYGLGHKIPARACFAPFCLMGDSR